MKIIEESKWVALLRRKEMIIEDNGAKYNVVIEDGGDVPWDIVLLERLDGGETTEEEFERIQNWLLENEDMWLWR